jgi:hypothetical protein
MQRVSVGSFVHIIDDLARGDLRSLTREQAAELAEGDLLLKG